MENFPGEMIFTLIINFVSLGNFLRMNVGFVNEMLNILSRVLSSNTWKIILCKRRSKKKDWNQNNK